MVFMKKITFIIALVSPFIIVSSIFANNVANINNEVDASANGSDSNIKVDINNNVNSNTNSNSSTSNKTNVSIHQEGGGTSEVTINGKTYKQEGPGDININEESNSNSTMSAKQELNTQSNATPNATVKPVKKAFTYEIIASIKNRIKGIGDAIHRLFLNLHIFKK